MRIQELLRNTPSKGELANLFRNDNIIKIDTDVGVYRTSASQLALGIIAHRNKMETITNGVHPVIVLGFLGSDETIAKLLRDSDVQLAIKTKNYDKPGVLGQFDPNTKEVSIAAALARVGANQVIAPVVAHEYGHKGLNMANSIPSIIKTIKQVSKLPYTPPYHAWGAHPDHAKQAIASMKRFHGTQFATLEHLMLYSYMNDRGQYVKLRKDVDDRVKPVLDTDGNLIPDPEIWQSVPGFEKMQTLDDAFEKADAIFNVIGRGIEQYLIKVAKEANKIPEDQLDELVYRFVKYRLGGK